MIRTRRSQRVTVQLPKPKGAPAKKATPTKKAAPKKKASPAKKAAPKKKGPARPVDGERGEEGDDEEDEDESDGDGSGSDPSDDSDGGGGGGDSSDSGDDDYWRPARAVNSNAFYMECELPDVAGGSPCGMTLAEAAAWANAFCTAPAGQPWSLERAWRSANDTLAGSQVVLAALRTGLGLPQAGDPFRVGVTANNVARFVYTMPIVMEMKSASTSKPKLQPRNLPAYESLRTRLVLYVMRFFGLTYSYRWKVDDEEMTNSSGSTFTRVRGVWCRGVIVGIYFNEDLRRFGAIVLFRHRKMRYEDDDDDDEEEDEDPMLMAVPDLDGFFKNQSRCRWPPVSSGPRYQTRVDSGYFYMNKVLNVQYLVWCWLDEVVLALKTTPPATHNAAPNRHVTTIIGNLAPQTGRGARQQAPTLHMYARLHREPPHFYVRVKSVDLVNCIVVVDYGTKYWSILHRDLRPEWHADGIRTMDHDACAAAWLRLVHDLPDNMMVAGGTTTHYAADVRHDIMVTYNQLVIYNKFQSKIWVDQNISYISSSQIKGVTGHVKTARASVIAFVHAGVASSAVRAAAMEAGDPLHRRLLVNRISYKLAVDRLRVSMLAAQTVSAEYWLRSNPLLRAPRAAPSDDDEPVQSDDSDNAPVTDDDGFIEDKVKHCPSFPEAEQLKCAYGDH